jgi:simple sugar transport system permease protein
MENQDTGWFNLSFRFGAVILAFLFTVAVLLLSGAPPLEAFGQLALGAFGSIDNFANVMVAWVPLLLATAGLLVTFAAGLWNIGMEGQITLGAIFATGALRMMQDSGLPPLVMILVAILAGAIGGALWAGLAGALKTFGGVNEIFGGLGLDFVATAITLWLIFGPWKRPGIGSMSGTIPFPQEMWMPMLPHLRLSIWALFIGILGTIAVYFLLQGTYFGLRLKAVGRNKRAANLTGIPTSRYMMNAFLICGLFAGVAGAIQVTSVYHRLIPSISSNYGWLGLLVAMLINYQPVWAAPVSLFFAALNIGSIQLPIVLKLDSSLSGVLQGALVLAFLIMEGARRRFVRGRGEVRS